MIFFFQSLEEEAEEYKPKIGETALKGTTLDMLIREATQPIEGPQLYRSKRVFTGKWLLKGIFSDVKVK